MAVKAPSLKFAATIHDTAASIRLGGDGAFITFAVPESDAAQVVGLVALKRTALKITVEVDYGDNKEKTTRYGKTGGQAEQVQ